jgi:hypothetical protein
LSDRNLEWLFRHVDDGRLGELFEPLLAHLDSDTGLLRAAIRRVRPEIEMLVERVRQRLALLLGQQAGECALLGFERLGQLDQ